MDLDRKLAIIAFILALAPGLLCAADDPDPLAGARDGDRVIAAEIGASPAPTSPVQSAASLP